MTTNQILIGISLILVLAIGAPGNGQQAAHSGDHRSRCLCLNPLMTAPFMRQVTPFDVRELTLPARRRESLDRQRRALKSPFSIARWISLMMPGASVLMRLGRKCSGKMPWAMSSSCRSVVRS